MSWRRFFGAGVLSLALTLTPAAAMTVVIDGVPMEEEVFVENDTTYVPLRAAAERLGDVTVEWRDGKARVSSWELSLSVRPGDQWLEANGRCFYIPDGVQTRNGRVMVPIRALASAMGGSVDWDGENDRAVVTSGGGVPVAADYNEEDLYWLSRIISAESRGEPMAGKLAVGTVVLNRVASSEFPDTIREVIFDQKWGVQFTPVSNGTVYDEPTQESIAAAKLVLEGVRVAGNSLYFLDPSQTSNHWTIYNRDYVTTIGCHQFYE